MPMTFTLTLVCESCKAVLRYEDERPAWKTYDYRVEEADECEKSARFVAEHADDNLTRVIEGEPWPAYIDAGYPRFVRTYAEDPPRLFMRSERRLTLAIPEPWRYIDCPVCDARVRKPMER
jgi:hypothetical protein